jgi:hypothetical protein
MSGEMRQILIGAVSQIDDPIARAKLATYLVAISPEYAVLQ